MVPQTISDSSLFPTAHTRLADLLEKGALLPSEWAERHRVLKTGPWRWDGYEYLRALHDDMHPQIVIAKGAQIGITETMLNRTLYFLDVKRFDSLYVFPTDDDVTQFSAARFDPALEMSAYLRELFSDVKNVHHKRAGAVNMYLRTAGSRSQMKSIPVAHLVVDEYDEMNPENVALARERTAGHRERYEQDVSTPTLPDFGIWKEWALSDQFLYYVPCPICGEFQPLKWEENLAWQGRDATTATFCCAHCHAHWSSEDRARAIAAGEWRLEQEGTSGRRGYHVSQLYSPTLTAELLVAAFLETEDDEAKRQNFFNSKLGLPYVAEGSRLSGELIESCIDGLRRPSESSADATMGIDVAPGGLNWIEIAEWWADHKTVVEARRANWDELDGLMQCYRVRQCVIDAMPETTKAREFAIRWPGRVLLAFYPEGLKTTCQVREDDQIVNINRTEALDKAFNRFRNRTVILPHGLELFDTYKAHLCVPVKTYKENRLGIPIARYVCAGADHFAHAAAYNEIAGLLSPAMGGFVESVSEGSYEEMLSA